MEIPTLGGRLKHARMFKGVTQEEASRLLKIKRATLASWEIDRSKPGPDELLKMAQVYNVTADFLLGNEKLIPSTNENITNIELLLDTLKITVSDIENILKNLKHSRKK